MVKEIIIKELANRLNTPASSVNPDAEFFNLGIDSLDAMEIFVLVQKITSQNLSPTLLFEYDTVNKIAAYVDSLETN
jgi:acyl carrier protein